MIKGIASLMRCALIFAGALIALEAGAVLPGGGGGTAPAAPTNVKASFPLGQYLKVTWSAASGATSYRVYLKPADSTSPLGSLVANSTSTSMVLTPTQIQNVVCPVFCDLHHAGYRVTVVAVNAYGTNYKNYSATPASGSVLWTLPYGPPTQTQVNYMNANCANAAAIALLSVSGAIITAWIPGLDGATVSGATVAVSAAVEAGVSSPSVALACMQ